MSHRKFAEKKGMEDEFGLLSASEQLFQLLNHYWVKAGKDRTAWADRVMTWDDSTPADLTRWHGALLAAGWIELNLAPTARVSADGVPDCYRLTPTGRQALDQARSARTEMVGASTG
jgi:hypothetical protein